MLEHMAPLDQLALDDANPIVRHDLEISPVGARSLLLLQGTRDAMLDPMLERGLSLPGPGTAAFHEGCAILWLGPREWLVDLPHRTGAMEVTVSSAALAVVTDVSDAYCCFDLTGAGARDLLAAGCSLDLAAFGAGSAARTRVAGLPVIVAVYPERERWRCFVDCALAAFFWRWLRRAAA